MEAIDIIREIRKQKKVSQSKIAELLNCSTGNYNDIEHHRNNLKVEDFIIICNFLEIPLSIFSKNEFSIELTAEDVKNMQNFSKTIDKINNQINIFNNGNVVIENNKKIKK